MEKADEKEVLSLDRIGTSMSVAERINIGIDIMCLGDKQGQISAQLQSLSFPV